MITNQEWNSIRLNASLTLAGWREEPTYADVTKPEVWQSAIEFMESELMDRGLLEKPTQLG